MNCRWRRGELFGWVLAALVTYPTVNPAAAPAPRSDVDWSGSQIPWVDMLGANLGGEFTPYITFSGLQPSVSFIFEIHTSHWTGSAWQLDVIRDGLIREPLAVTAWNPDQDEIIYAYHTGLMPPVLSWRDRDIATGALGPELDFGDVVADPNGVFIRPSVAVRSDGEPAVTWFTQPPGGVAGLHFSRWDSGAVPPGPTIPRRLQRCSGDWPTLLLDENDVAHVSCRDLIAADHFDINYVVFDGINQNTEAVFGAADDHDWRRPAMAFLDDEPVIVAYDADAMQTVLRIRGAGGWQAPIVISNGIPVGHLSIDTWSDGVGDSAIGIGITSGNQVIYTEYTIAAGVGTQGPLRRMDLNPDTGLACEAPRDVGRVLLSDDGTRALGSWIVNATATEIGHQPVHVARFTQFRRADTDEWTSFPPTTPVTTSLALDDAGDGWTCYFDDSVNNPPQVDLFVRFRDDPPLVAAADTGYPLDGNGRGCDVAIAPDGRLGVLWSHTVDVGGVPTGLLRYRERVGGIFGLEETILDGITPVVNRGHLALAFDSSNTAHGLFARHLADVHPWIAHRAAANVWTLEQVDTFKGGRYPDLAYADGSVIPHASYVLTDFGGTVTYATGIPWQHFDLVNNATCFDTSISLRALPGGLVGAVGWVNFSTGQVESAFIDDKVVRVLDDTPGFNDYLAIEIDAEGEVAASYRKDLQPFPSTLRISHVRPFSGGQDEPDPPEPGRVRCDLRESEWGTDLELDRFDNPRIMHRTATSSPLAIFRFLRFVTRP